MHRGAQAWAGNAYYGIAPGRWTSSDIIMDDVECDGSETSLQRCQYEDTHDCTVSEAASVACRPNEGRVERERVEEGQVKTSSLRATEGWECSSVG